MREELICNFGWYEERDIITVFAIIEITKSKRKGILGVTHRSNKRGDALGKGICVILSKLKKEITQNMHLTWSFPGITLMEGSLEDHVVNERNAFFSLFVSVEHPKEDSYLMQHESIYQYLRRTLFKKEGWSLGKVEGTSWDNFQKNKSNKPYQKSLILSLPDNYVALDLETTDKNTNYARVIEIGAIKISNNKISCFHTFVNPRMTVPKKVRDLTGITKEQLTDAPPPWKALRDLYEFIGDIDIIIGHNVTYDLNVLHKNCLKFGMYEWRGTYYCTQKSIKQRIPDLEDTKLETVCNALNITNEHAHRAIYDANASRLIFERLHGVEPDQHLKFEFQ